MEPSKEQHSFFTLPAWPRYPLEKNTPRKRRRSNPDPDPESPSTPPPSHQDPQTSWTPVNQDPQSPPSSLSESAEHETSSLSKDEDEDEHLPPTSRRGGHTKRFTAILRNNNLPPAPQVPYSLRNKHLTVMTAILHRSVMENDFTHASRAYGLLIRSKDVDIRRIWELGVEILLKRGGFGQQEEGEEETKGYKPENLPKAIEFLNRLILFYPFHRRVHTHHPSLRSSTATKKSWRPLRPSVLDFYPALFALLIKAAEHGSEDANPELQPRKIKEKIESLMLGPPWPDMAGMWLLRGMVCNWIADLEKEGRKEMREEAEGCFEEVRKRGGIVPQGVEGGDESDEDGMEDEVESGSEGDES